MSIIKLFFTMYRNHHDEFHHEFFIFSRKRQSRAVGGADRDRTDDLKLAKLPLSQLSYSPDHAPRNGGPGKI